MDFHERITTNPAVRFGKPCARGTRLSVGDVLGCLADNADRECLLIGLGGADDLAIWESGPSATPATLQRPSCC